VRIAIGCDHRGFPYKAPVSAALSADGHATIDFGTDSTDAADYPDFAKAVGTAVRDGRADVGVLICGSGAGVSIAANKITGIRAAVVHDTYTAHQAVEHDDMNVLCLGARVIGPALALEIATAFLAAAFSDEARHRRRLNKILAMEQRQAQKRA
jgi:ribose 5-phosphate isomerase B